MYGWPARLTAFVLPLLVVIASTPLISRLMDAVSPEQVGVGLSRLATLWIIAGVLFGKDLTWHTRLDKLTFLPCSSLAITSCRP